MKTKNELFIDAVDYLIDNGLATDQGDVALQAGLGPNLISRVRTGKVKNVSDDSIRALVSKFNLNIDYFRGKSEYLSRYDQSCANMEHKLKEAQRLLDKSPYPKASEPVHPEIPDYVKRLCEETARLATRNEMLERQCENLIAELRDSKDKNEAFLVEIKASQKFNDALVADLRISRTQNDTLIAELRETRKENTALTSELADAKSKLDDALLSIEGMKNQLSMILGNMTAINDKANLATLRVNDDGEPVIMIHGLADTQDNKKVHKVPNGYIKGDIRIITNEMVQQALKAFPDKKK